MKKMPVLPREPRAPLSPHARPASPAGPSHGPPHPHAQPIGFRPPKCSLGMPRELPLSRRLYGSGITARPDQAVAYGPGGGGGHRGGY